MTVKYTLLPCLSISCNW